MSLTLGVILLQSDPEKFGDRSVCKVRACGAHVHNRNTTLIHSKSHRF